MAIRHNRQHTTGQSPISHFCRQGFRGSLMGVSEWLAPLNSKQDDSKSSIQELTPDKKVGWIRRSRHPDVHHPAPKTGTSPKATTTRTHHDAGRGYCVGRRLRLFRPTQRRVFVETRRGDGWTQTILGSQRAILYTVCPSSITAFHCPFFRRHHDNGTSQF